MFNQYHSLFYYVGVLFCTPIQILKFVRYIYKHKQKVWFCFFLCFMLLHFNVCYGLIFKTIWVFIVSLFQFFYLNFFLKKADFFISIYLCWFFIYLSLETVIVVYGLFISTKVIWFPFNSFKVNYIDGICSSIR